MSKNPYHVPMGFESTKAPEGTAWVIRKTQSQGPKLYFVREYHMGTESRILEHAIISRRSKTEVCYEYWSPFLNLALNYSCFTRWELVIEWMKHLESSGSLVLSLGDGPVDVVSVKFVDIFRERMPYARAKAARFRPSETAVEATTFMKWLTTYDNGQPKPQPLNGPVVGLYRPRGAKRTEI